MVLAVVKVVLVFGGDRGCRKDTRSDTSEMRGWLVMVLVVVEGVLMLVMVVIVRLEQWLRQKYPQPAASVSWVLAV